MSPIPPLESFLQVFLPIPHSAYFSTFSFALDRLLLLFGDTTCFPGLHYECFEGEDNTSVLGSLNNMTWPTKPLASSPHALAKIEKGRSNNQIEIKLITFVELLKKVLWRQP